MLLRHSSGVSETHLTISSSKNRPSSFQVSRACVMIGRWCQSCGVCSGRMHGTRTLHVQESYTKPHLGESGRSRARARDRAWCIGVGGYSCVRSPAEVVDPKTSVTGASRVTRQLLFHHPENRRCRVTRCSSDSNCGGSSAQLQVYVVHVLPCVLCAL